MKLEQNIVDKINEEYERWRNVQYGSNDEKQRKSLGQFYTPPALSIKMLEKFDDLNGTILDPTCGAGRFISSCYYCWC